MKLIQALLILLLQTWGTSWAQKPELVVQLGHISSIEVVAFSPDGKHILTGGEDKEAKLWDLNGRELQSYSGHSSEVKSVAFSPDGKYILTGSEDGKVKLWDLNGRELRSISADNKGILAVDFSPDGKLILTGGRDSTAKLWDLNGKKNQSFEKHTQGVKAVAFSPDGKHILTGSWDGKAKLWDLNGRELQSISAHNKGVWSVDFSSNGKLILTGGRDSTAKLWDLKGQELQHFVGHRDGINSVALSPDGKYLLTGSEDGKAKLWELSGRELHSFNGHKYGVTSVDFSPDGKKIITSSDQTAKLWKINSQQLQAFCSYNNQVSSVAFSPDGNRIVTGGSDSIVKLWKLNGIQQQSFRGHRGEISTVVFSPEGNRILTGSKDGTARIWDLNGQELHNYGGHTWGVWSVAFSQDGKQILTGSGGGFFGGEAKLWGLDGQELQNFNSHEREVNSVAFSPRGKHILTGSADSTAELMDLNGNFLEIFRSDIGDINSVTFSPDGQKILIGSGLYGPGEAKLYNLNGQELQSFIGHSSSVTFAVFSYDGNYILTGGRDPDNTAKIWDLKGRQLQNLSGHRGGVNSGAFSPNGQHILTCSRDGTTKLWDASSGENLLTFITFSGETNSWVITDPDQYYMVSKQGTDFIHFKIGLTAYNFDQFDLRLNRPDKILKKLLPLGVVDSIKIIQYRNAYNKRLEKYGFTEDMLADDYHVPECKIQNQDDLPISTTESSVKLSILATDSLRLLDRLHVFVNDVPIYGIPGINLRGQNTQEYKTGLDIPLSRGSNKIQISALNQGGAESLKATTYITYDAPEEKPDLYLVTIGVSDYQEDGKDLRYAAKDARDIAALYQNASGFREVHTKVLTDEQVTKTDILALRTWLEQSRVDDQVLLYVSGHGLIDDSYDFYYATHDIDFANPAGKGILYDKIEGLLDGIPARKKLLLMDACHSGEYDADAPPLTAAQQDSLARKGVSFKGFSKGDDESGPTLGLQNSFEMMQQLFADLRRGSGATVITSSAGVQVSFEDAEWENGAFTYAFLYGLKSMKADSNQDGQVTASEIQAFVAEYVPRLTEGLQAPTFRRENLEFDFRVW